MACCLYFFQGSKTWLALLVPIFAVFARFSSGHGTLLISVSLSILLILFSTLFLFMFTKQKPIILDSSSLLKEATPPRAENIEFSPQEKQENTLISSSADCSCNNDLGEVVLAQAETDLKKTAVEDSGQNFLIKSQDLYSESESMDQFSSTSSEEDHSSDTEWPYYNMGHRLDCSDDSISDEESLIEIAIPSGQFVSPDKDHPRFNLMYCKLSADFTHQEAIFQKDFLADMNEMNEEDNLIEIDIYMGSIKYSRFDL